MLTIDATNLIAGRLATFIAKKALEKENIIIINSEKAVLAGKKKVLLAHYRQKIERGDPHHGPYYPKAPERILRRIIRGMLPHQQARGREAYKRVKCFKGNEENKQGKTLEQFNVTKLKKTNYLTLQQLSSELK